MIREVAKYSGVVTQEKVIRGQKGSSFIAAAIHCDFNGDASDPAVPRLTIVHMDVRVVEEVVFDGISTEVQSYRSIKNSSCNNTCSAKETSETSFSCSLAASTPRCCKTCLQEIHYSPR